MSEPTLLGLSGSLRTASTNRKLLREAARLFGPCTYAEADLHLPLYDGDEEAASGVPAIVEALAQQIAKADAVLVATPEYNKGISGVLKNALDWISRTKGQPWSDKPVAVMSSAAGRAGGERAQAMLRQCLIAFQPRLITGPEVHLAAAHTQFDDQGRLTGDLYIETLTELMGKMRRAVGTP